MLIEKYETLRITQGETRAKVPSDRKCIQV